MTSHDEPNAEEAQRLFVDLEKKFPSEKLGQEGWYLVVVRVSKGP